ncbi:MAG: hypothetical protein P1P88_17090 [Bacteroidales bacterium]|nr:hypothetical protein [Bacteroidales bacterium]
MRIITHSLDQISGLDILASGSLIVFFILFLWILYRIFRTSKKDATKWANLPLDLDDEIPEMSTNETANA